MNKFEIEKLTNRIIINLGVAFFAYILLWVMSKLFMPNSLVFTLIGIFAAAAVLMLVLSKKCGYPLKNYIYMFTAFTLALIYTKLSVIITMFIGIHNCVLLQNIKFFSILLNTSVAVKTIAILGGVYLVIMLVYNQTKIIKLSKTK